MKQIFHGLGSLVVPALLLAISVAARAADLPDRPLSLPHPGGLAIIPIMEGWIGNEDGSATISFGFVNRNTDAAIDIPLGESNYIEPAEFDGLQPSHFGTGRHTGVFTVTIPADRTDESIWWHIKTGAQEEYKVPGRAGAAAYELDFVRPRPQGSLQPLAWFADEENKAAGLMALIADYPVEVTVNSEITLSVSAIDPSERDPADNRFKEPLDLSLHWFKHQGPGDVNFSLLPTDMNTTEVAEDDEEPVLNKVIVKGGAGTARISATFSAPGEYLVRTLVENFSAPDSSRGNQCCWTNVFQRITVTP